MKCNVSLLSLILALGTLYQAAAASLNPTGTWKWNKANPDGRIPDITITLKFDGQRLTGTITRSGGTMVITNGVFRNDKLSFQTVRDGKAGKTTYTYSGKISGDTIQGEIEIDVRGKKITDNWEARRVKV